MKRILVPTDFSYASESALKLASAIADNTGAEIFLINFTPHPFDESFTTMGDFQKRYDDEETIFTIHLIKRNTERLKELATRYTEGRVINIQVYGEELIGGVENYVKDKNIDIIIMGTSGEETAKEFFTGNHTEQVMENSSIPVLSLREGQEEADFTNIALGVELESDEKDNFRAATSYVRKFAQDLGSKLHLVHVAKPGTKNRDEVEKQLHEFAQKFNFEDYSVNLHYADDTEDGLIRFARLNDIGVLAVMSHTEGGLFRVFRSSTSEDLSKESEIPLLSINLHNV